MAYTQDEINYGQARINFDLCEVDMKLIEILREIVEVLKTGTGLPPSETSQFKDVDFNQLEIALDEAEKASGAVADIRPPGCISPPPYPNPGD